MARSRPPYVSHIKLLENSRSAMLAAIELFNKPRIEYRSETTIILMVNAWELAVKAVLRKNGLNIHRRKQRNRPYESKSLSECLDIMRNKKLWPDSLDGIAATTNIIGLVDYRNRAIHLYNADGLGSILYMYMQQSIINYRDLLYALTGKDLADSITWDLLPLGASPPAEAVQFMSVDAQKRAVPEINEFIATLRKELEEVERSGGDTGRVFTYYDIHLQNHKNASSADLTVTYDASSDAKVVRHKVDPNTTYPLRASDVLERVNKKRTGRKLNSHDRTVIIWREEMATNPRYSFQHQVGPSRGWSHETVTFMASKDDTYYDRIRSEYKQYMKEKKDKNKKT